MKFIKRKYSLILISTDPLTLSLLKDQIYFLDKVFELTIISNLKNNPFNKDYVQSLHSTEFISVPFSRKVNLLLDLKCIFKLIYVYRRKRPDIIHSFTYKVGYISTFSSYIAGVKNRVHTFTGLLSPTSIGLKKIFYLVIECFISAFSTHIISESKSVFNILENSFVPFRSNSVIGYGGINGVDINYFNPNYKIPIDLVNSDNIINEIHNLKKRFRIFTFVGRLTKDKGLIELVNSFKELKSNCKLIIIGENDKLRPLSIEILNIINNLENILYIGYKNDIRAFLSMSDVFVLPSYREGLPNVILEAMAMQLPILATDVPGCRDLVTNDFNGWLIVSKSKDALLKKIKNVSEYSDSYLKEMGIKSRQIAKKKYNSNDQCHRMLKFYNSIL